jgi:hypothetical protein
MAELAYGLFQRTLRDLLVEPLTEQERARAVAPNPAPMHPDNHESVDDRCLIGNRFLDSVVRRQGFEWVNESPKTGRPKWGYVANTTGSSLVMKVNSKASSGDAKAEVGAAPCCGPVLGAGARILHMGRRVCSPTARRLHAAGLPVPRQPPLRWRPCCLPCPAALPGARRASKAPRRRPQACRHGPRRRPAQVLVELAYLKSYEHMGKVRLVCEAGCTCQPLELDAHHQDRTSLTHLQVGAACRCRCCRCCRRRRRRPLGLAKPCSGAAAPALYVARTVTSTCARAPRQQARWQPAGTHA